MSPLAFRGPGRDALALARRALESMPGCRVTDSAPDYLRAEFTSRVLRFVDDLELLLDEGSRVLQVRSASRRGHWDLGVNRRRVEELRRRFDRLQVPP